MSEMEQVIDLLEELSEDVTVPKNVKEKVVTIISFLKEDAEESIRVNKALNELEEISNDTNIQPYTRTQMWQVVSILENLSS